MNRGQIIAVTHPHIVILSRGTVSLVMTHTQMSVMGDMFVFIFLKFKNGLLVAKNGVTFHSENIFEYIFKI